MAKLYDKHTVMQKKLHNLNMVHLNARSLRKNMGEVELFVKTRKNADVILIGETWLYSEEEKFFGIPGYSACFNSNNLSRGGGTVIYVKQNLEYRVLEMIDQFNTIIISLSNTIPVLKIAVCYKKPHDNNRDFIAHLDLICDRYKNIVVMGDTNIDLLADTELSRSYKAMLESNGVRIINKLDKEYATRITDHSSTIIDHVCSDLEKYEIDFKLHDVVNLDHKAICVMINKVVKKMEPIFKREIYTTNYQIFKAEVRNALTTNNIACVDDLIKILQRAKENSMVKKHIRIRKDNLWMTPELLNMMKKRNKLFKKLKNNPNCLEIQARFKYEKNRVTYEIKKAKQNYFNNKIQLAGSDKRKIWKVLNNCILKRPAESNIIIKDINTNGSRTSDNLEIANVFNTYFSEIGNKLADKINDADKFTIKNRSTEQTIFFHPTDEQEIHRIIMKLKVGSPGGDNISAVDLKQVVSLISPKIACMINSCLSTGIYPNCLKSSVVIPIHKSGSKMEVSNYRPITLTNCIGKIFEKAINVRIQDFIQNVTGFDMNQFGFQKNIGTDSAVLESTNSIINKLDAGNYVCSVFVDLKKAFDTVDHKILLDRLHEIGIRGTAHELLKSYLKDRKAVTKINGVLSNQSIINVGVPQGSVLGPTLYLLYIHNIQYANLVADYKIFADDTLLIYKAKTRHELESIINMDLCRFNNWLKGNKLSINAEKTKYIIYKVRNKADIDLNLLVNEKAIERVTAYKYLGVVIDEKLKWEEHIDSIIKKIVPLLGIIKRSGITLTKQTADNLYHAHIISHIRYNICNWSSCSSGLKDRIGIIINKAIKGLHKFNWLTPTNEVFNRTGYLKLHELIVLEKSKLIFKMEKGIYNKNKLITNRSSVHNYNTRRINHLHHIKSRIELSRNSCLSSAIRLYNRLPNNLKESSNIEVFIKKLKYLMKNDSSQMDSIMQE